MSVLGALLGTGETRWSEWTTVSEQLAVARRAGVDFDTAWPAAIAAAGIDDSRAHGELTVWARPRFERAFYRLNPSMTATTEDTDAQPSRARSPRLSRGDRGRQDHDRARAVAA